MASKKSAVQTVFFYGFMRAGRGAGCVALGWLRVV